MSGRLLMEGATVTKRLLIAASCLALTLALGWAPGAAAKKKPQTPDTFSPGTYVAKTNQETVAIGFRTFQFRVTKKNKVILETEPVVRKELCTSTPVFTLDGATPSKPLSRRGAFAFDNTFEGTKIDRIKGQFVNSTTVEGFALYNFQGESELCSPGSIKVEFKARKQKK